MAKVIVCTNILLPNLLILVLLYHRLWRWQNRAVKGNLFWEILP
uniref:Uncharacterized protein n=1 Tax=Rhizophora mucronata TaxID=61149 RepID=A0A2P2NHG6_RHIMU